MGSVSDFNLVELGKFLRFILRAKFDPPVDEKAFTPEINRLLDAIRDAAERLDDPRKDMIVLGYFRGSALDQQNLRTVIEAARHEFQFCRGHISFRDLVETGIYPFVLDESGLSEVAKAAESIETPQSSRDPRTLE